MKKHFTLLLLAIFATATSFASTVKKYQLVNDGLVACWDASSWTSGLTWSDTQSGKTLTFASTPSSSDDGIELTIASAFTSENLSALGVSYPCTFEWVGRIDGNWSTSPGRVFCLGVANATWNNCINAYANSSSNGLALDLNSSKAISSGINTEGIEYHIVVVVNSEGTTTLYVNSTTAKGTFASNGASTSDKNYLSNSQPNNNGFIGAIRRMALWNKALSSDEINTLFTETPKGEGDTFEEDPFTLVNSSNPLTYGDEVILVGVNNGSYYAMSTTQNSSSRSSVSVTPSNNSIYRTDEMQVMTYAKSSLGSYALFEPSSTSKLYIDFNGTDLKTWIYDHNYSAMNVSIASDGTATIKSKFSQTSTTECRYIAFNGTGLYFCGQTATAPTNVQIYRRAAAEETTLANLVQNGVLGQRYKVTDATGVTQFQAHNGDYYVATKDAANAVYNYSTPATGDAVYNIKDNAQESYSQNNWMLLNMGDDATNYNGKQFTVLRGLLTSKRNPTLVPYWEKTTTTGTQATAQVYCPVNFMGNSSVASASHGNFYFVQPKACEYLKVVSAVYDGGKFYIPVCENGVNGNNFSGGFNVDWSFNYNGEIVPTDLSGAYQFDAIAMLNNDPTNGSASARKKVSPKTGSVSTVYTVYPISMTLDNLVTAVKDVDSSKVVKGVRYYNIMGVESAQPFDGMNIMVTTYSDGTTSSVKVMK